MQVLHSLVHTLVSNPLLRYVYLSLSCPVGMGVPKLAQLPGEARMVATPNCLRQTRDGKHRKQTLVNISYL